MTEKRKQYLAGISKEEQTIRDTIVFFKISITYDKEQIRRESNDLFIALYKESIKESKTVIKTLRKHLPAPVLAGETCSVCKFSHEDSLIFPDYCACCGQKLR